MSGYCWNCRRNVSVTQILAYATDSDTFDSDSDDEMIVSVVDEGGKKTKKSKKKYSCNRCLEQLVSKTVLGAPLMSRKSKPKGLSHDLRRPENVAYDFHLVGGNEGKDEAKVGVHRTLLYLRSPVFAKMAGWKEDETRELTLEDVSSTTIKKFVEFIYTDKIEAETIPSLLVELLMLGEKYEMPKLKWLAEGRLIEWIDRYSIVQNKQNYIPFCLHMYAMADLHRADDLKGRVTREMVTNLGAFLKNKAWKELVDKKPTMTKELLDIIAEGYVVQAHPENKTF